VFIDDDPDTIRRRVAKAFCPPEETRFNPVLNWMEQLVFALDDADVRIERGEAWLIGAHIAPYGQGNRNNHEPTRTRKLLLHRDQIAELIGRTQAKGFTLVPLKLYIRDGMAKLELGVGKGKKAYDKRRTIAERVWHWSRAREIAPSWRRCSARNGSGLGSCSAIGLRGLSVASRLQAAG